MRIKLVRLLLSAALLTNFCAAVDVDPKLYMDNIRFLASNQLKGRLDGTKELDQAAAFIADQFRQMGLQPAGEDGFFQRFRVTTSARSGKKTSLSYRSGATVVNLKPDLDFRPSSMSANGSASGKVVFAGYGITAREYGYDDYEGLNAAGKVVLVMRHEPREYDDSSVFGGKVQTNHSQIQIKAANAKAHGAAAVILVSDTPTHPGYYDALDELGEAVGPDSEGIVLIEMKAEVAERWLSLAGKSLDEVIKTIDKDMHGHSFPLPDLLSVNLSVELRRSTKPVSNVIAFIPGTTGEYLILGAHYDHVGTGNQYSMQPAKRGEVHPGADDNASGTSGILELARWFSRQPPHGRGILFVAYAGEEFGLLGSNYYAAHPAKPLTRAVAMINLDMIGRVRQNRVYVGGVNTGSGLKELVQAVNDTQQPGFDIDDSDTGGYGSSDHYSFAPYNVPFLLFFSGLHPDYHTPGDTWDKVDAAEASRLLKLVGEIIERLLDAPGRPAFMNTSGQHLPVSQRTNHQDALGTTALRQLAQAR
jgi:hypothetical protein